MAGVISRKKVQIPVDVTVEILKLLPVKSLLRFSCACKTWYSIISDPEFCNKVHQKRGAYVLLCERFETFEPIESLLKNEETPIRSTIPLPLPWEPEHMSSTKFLGSCKGLVCVYHTSSYRDMSDLILWNPSTRKFRRLPPPCRRVLNGYNQGRSAGFGYDGSKDDYKFVWMACRDHRPPQRRIEFDVFSLKSKTWSRFDHCHPSDIILSNTDSCIRRHTWVFSNGVIHWIVCYKDRSSNGIRILALDLASDSYRLLETPRECELGSSKVVSLSGSLCLCTRTSLHLPMSWYSLINLWTMKEFGMDSSWMKLVSLPTTLFIPRRISLYTYHLIHFSSEEGSIVAMGEYLSSSSKERCEIVRFQVKNGAVVRYETLLSVSRDDVTIVLEETLVSLN